MNLWRPWSGAIPANATTFRSVLQQTNILREVGEDWRMGRMYLSKEELEAFSLIESDISPDGRGEKSCWSAPESPFCALRFRLSMGEGQGEGR